MAKVTQLGGEGVGIGTQAGLALSHRGPISTLPSPPANPGGSYRTSRGCPLRCGSRANWGRSTGQSDISTVCIITTAQEELPSDHSWWTQSILGAF